MKSLVIEKARAFDTDGIIKKEVETAVGLLKNFREKYPIVEHPESIETLRPDDIFKNETGEIGDFFHWIEYYLKPLGHLTLYSNVYRRIRSHFDIFKELLYVVVDKEKSLAQKVDAQWNEIRGLGSDRHIAKKVIFCFNYETERIVPIFSTGHLEYFLETILERPEYPQQYENMSHGEKYEFLTEQILTAKESSVVTEHWETTYFCRFLYETYPPPRIVPSSERKRLADKAIMEQKQQYREFINMLNELRRNSKISAEDFRSYRKQWEEHPQDRKLLVDRLSRS
jgi:hypothetical protein